MTYLWHISKTLFIYNLKVGTEAAVTILPETQDTINLSIKVNHSNEYQISHA